MNKYVWLIVICAAACAASLFASERGFPDTQTEHEIKELLKKVKPAYAFVAGGSGAVISADGYVVTNHHVVGRGKKFDIRLGDGRSFKADVLGIDPRGDLALLKIQNPENLTVLPLADSDRVRLGQFCIALGNPFGMGSVDQEPTLSFGVVSGIHVYFNNYTDAVVTDAPINPGNSGGPLINMKGELIGINGMINLKWGLRSNAGLAYAIPANQVKMWIPLLEKAQGKAVYHGRLIGLTLEAEGKARVKEVKEGSDAEKAGFKKDDIIASFEGKEVWNGSRFWSILGIFPAGREVTATVQREGGTQNLTFKLAELRPGKFGFKFARPRRNDKFLKIGEVVKGSNAEKAGLRKGDEIIEVMGQKMSGNIIQQWANLSRWMSQRLPQFEVKLKVKRGKGNNAKEIDITYETE